MQNLEAAGFINVRSTTQEIPFCKSSGYSTEEYLGKFFTELLLSGLEIVEEIPGVTMCEGSNFMGKIRAVLSGRCRGHFHFMKLVRIMAQKPDGQ